MPHQTSTGSPHDAEQNPNGAQEPHDAETPPDGRTEPLLTDEQWTDALKAVGRAVRRARTASRDGYELMPVADADSGLEPYYSAIEDRIYQLRERTCQWDEMDGTTQEIARQAAIAAKDAAVEEWTPVCGRLAITHQEVIDRLRAERDQARRWAVALENQLAAVQQAVHIADDEDVTDWQRGYRACAERVQQAATEDQP